MTQYAIIPKDHWKNDLLTLFPHSPTIQEYKVLVFPNNYTEELNIPHKNCVMKKADTISEVLDHILVDCKDWLLLDITLLRDVYNNMYPPEEFTSE